MHAVAPKNIVACSGLSLIEGPGPCEKAPRYRTNPVTNSTIAAMNTVEPSPTLRFLWAARKRYHGAETATRRAGWGPHSEGTLRMSDERRFLSREDLLLLFWAVALGLAGAAAFGAFRAVSASDEDTAARFGVFAMNLLWPGVLILLGVAAVVVMGWKANLD